MEYVMVSITGVGGTVERVNVAAFFDIWPKAGAILLMVKV